MKILIVFDSFYGNTEKIARAIGGSFSSEQCAMVRVQDFKPEQLKGLDLLIVGSPTRAFSPSELTKKFLDTLPAKSLSGIKTAAFDTRMNVEEIKSGLLKIMSKAFGYAAPTIAKKLQSKGGDQVIEPEGFYVNDSEGPLKEGEQERAAKWLANL